MATAARNTASNRSRTAGGGDGRTFTLSDVEVYWVKCDPENPAPAFEESGRPKWEIQIRTESATQNKAWKEAGIATKVKEDESTGERLYWYATLRKPAVKADGTPAKPIKFVDGNLDPVDPNTVGNGSRCNIRVFAVPYEIKSKGKVTKSGISNMPTDVQVLLHKVYTPTAAGPAFEKATTTRVAAGGDQDMPEPGEHEDEDDNTEGSGEGTGADGDGAADPEPKVVKARSAGAVKRPRAADPDY